MYESHSFKTVRGAAVLTDLSHPAGRDGITPSKWKSGVAYYLALQNQGSLSESLVPGMGKILTLILLIYGKMMT